MRQLTVNQTSLIFAMLFTCQVLTGQENPVTAEDRALIGKKPLEENILAAKREGGYFTGLPLINSDPDKGIGYGVRVNHFNNGTTDDRFFRYTPYLTKTFIQYFATTNGFQYHTVDFDAPYFRGSPYRLRTSIIIGRNINANYFGTGSETLASLKAPNGQTYDTYEKYRKELRKIESGSTYSYYNTFDMQKQTLKLTIDRDLWKALPIKLFVNLRIEEVGIKDYSGTQVLASQGEKALMKTTKLKEDNDAGKIKGFSGGNNNALKLGLAYDSRDFEPDPRKGFFAELTYEWANKTMGSVYDYQRLLLSKKVFFNPSPNLVFAMRTTYQTVEGNLPFYAYSRLGYIEGDVNGLGGLRSLRGFKDRRFVGSVMALANIETRYQLTQAMLGNQRFEFKLVPFLDWGTIADKQAITELQDGRSSVGLGIRAAWNQATIIMIDYGTSPESSGLYINFNHIF